jgi:hypothetical protein
VLGPRHVDVTETNPFFHSYGADGKVYLITNNPSTCGADIAVDRFQDFIQQQLH